MNKKNTIENKPYGFGEVMSMLEAMNDGINLISEVQSEHTKKFEKIDERFDRLEGRMDNLESGMGQLQEDVTEIKHKLSQKVDLEDFQKLEKRLLHVEKMVLKFSQKY